MTEESGQGSVTSDPSRRRYLTLVFSDLSDSTQLAEDMEAEDYAEMLRRLHDVYQTTVAKHGGTVVRIQGDGMLAIFGHPSAQEDDGRRGVEAALDLRDAAQTLTVSTKKGSRSALGVHTGIHSGLVLVNGGDIVRGRFELHGHAPSVAAKLAAVAQKHEILVSEVTLGLEGHFYEIRQKLSLNLKGKTRPLTVLQVVARAHVRTRFEASVQRGLAVFMGRQTELEQLRFWLADTLSGTPRHVLISAPPGLGKTRLAYEFLQRAASLGCEVHRGYCEPYLSAEPLQPFLHILRRIRGVETGAPLDAAEAALQNNLASANREGPRYGIASANPSKLHPIKNSATGGTNAPFENLIASIPAMFEALALKAPQVIFIDDWHWADDASRQMVRTLRAINGRPIFILHTARSFEAHDAGMIGTQVINLGPLSDVDATQAVSRLLPGIDPFLSQQLCRQAGGNPLFIEELCHSVGHDVREQAIAESAMGGAWLSTLIESRLDRLRGGQANLVRLAAVIGNVIPSWLFEKVTGLGEQHADVKELARQDFILPSDTPGFLQFKHGVARDVIYASVGLKQRLATHLLIADALLQRSSSSRREEFCELLAYHYSAGGNAIDAATYASMAGDKAVAASALDRAQAQYRAALSALDQTEQVAGSYGRWMAIVMRLSLACVFDPSREHLEILRRALDRAMLRDDQELVAQSEYWLGYVHYALGEARISIGHLERSLAISNRIGNRPLAMQIVATLGQAKAAMSSYAEALELLDLAIADKRIYRKNGQPAVGSAYSLACKAAALGDQGQFSKAYECFEEALGAVRGSVHEVEGSILCWKSGVQLWQGRWDDAEESARQARQVAERVKSLYVFSMSTSLGAFADWKSTHCADSIVRIADATSWLETRARGLFISLNYGWLAESLVADGSIERARHFAAHAFLRARAKHDYLGQAMSYRAMAVAMSAAGRKTISQQYLMRATQNAERRGSRHELAVTALCQAHMEVENGNRFRATPLLDKVQREFEDMDMNWHVSLTVQIRNNS